MIKAIFFDIDGTLISFKTHRMPDSTSRSLERLKERGILTFVATGRHISEIHNLDGWKPDGFITLNGAYCVVQGEVVFKRSIDPNDILSLTRRLGTGEFYPFIFVGKDGMWVSDVDEKVLRMLRMVDLSMPEKASLEMLHGMEIFQLMGFFREKDEASVMELLPHCHTTRWSDLFTDIIPVGTDKWEGISKVIERFGIKRDQTMAFGDGGNDISMIRGAGIGVAMGNGAEYVQAEADYVTASVDNDGITKALEHFGII